MRQTIQEAPSVVIKLGTSTLTKAHHPNMELINALCKELKHLCSRGLRPIVTTSGAIHLGEASLPRAGRAAVGQLRLMAAFARCLEPHGYRPAQVLLKSNDLQCRTTRARLSEAIDALSLSNAIVLVNENDVTSAVSGFTSNDELSAALAEMLGAPRLIIFTDRPGVYHADPRLHPDARLFDTVAADDARLHAAASATPTAVGTGGMKSKINAARMAARGGATTVITCYTPGKLRRIVDGERLGTWIVPDATKTSPLNPKVKLEEEFGP
ncbi:hypothetical protein [Burkholderia gladioli]|uniref:amino acid kinase family protein n=1 Tax=Burkholderia gladioli TaxID=28095 RepID=UPI0022D0EFC1|nr:hypothetical protein [Burkholderia gladioli]MDA0574069.1 hypothetical protein [Burkholderia gladioli]MDA0602362.1 hypothetical protein [Burkholderia gladioli]